MTRVGTGELDQLDPELLRWAQMAQYEWLACRDVKHAWPADVESLTWSEEIYQGRRVWVRTAACMHNCGVSRAQRRDQLTGERFTRYDYPTAEDGQRSLYLLPRGHSALTADDIFRLQMALIPPAGGSPAKKTRRGRRH